MPPLRHRSFWHRATVIAGVLAACVAGSAGLSRAAPLLHAVTVTSQSAGVIPVVLGKNEPTGTFLQPSTHAGLCQCITETNARLLSCHSSAAECQSVCAAANYSFVPDAVQSCSGSGAVSPTTPASTSAPMSPGR